MSDLPVVVIGAGPQGLAAAAHLLERGLEPLVLESGLEPASAVAEWGHVRLFSAWPELVDQAVGPAAGADRLDGARRAGYPTGAEWIDGYLAPLAKALGDRVRYDARVTGVSRKGRDRLVDADRAEQPFTVHVVDSDGIESRLEARAVIDASGTWRRPNPAGADGLPALGERAAADADRLPGAQPCHARAVRRQAHRRGGCRRLGVQRHPRAGPDRRRPPGHPDHLGDPPRRQRQHLRRRRRR